MSNATAQILLRRQSRHIETDLTLGLVMLLLVLAVAIGFLSM